MKSFNLSKFKWRKKRTQLLTEIILNHSNSRRHIGSIILFNRERSTRSIQTRADKGSPRAVLKGRRVRRSAGGRCLPSKCFLKRSRLTQKSPNFYMAFSGTRQVDSLESSFQFEQREARSVNPRQDIMACLSINLCFTHHIIKFTLLTMTWTKYHKVFTA